MAELFPKFIIEDGVLIIGKCTYHKELAEDKDKVQGGGWFNYDSERNAFILHGESYDFGTAKVEDIQAAVDNNQVFGRSRISKMDNHTFIYRDKAGQETILKEYGN